MGLQWNICFVFQLKLEPLAAMHSNLYPYLDVFSAIFCPREEICMADKQLSMITDITRTQKPADLVSIEREHHFLKREMKC